MREAEAAWTRRRRTLVLVNLASVFEKADEALYAVPAVYQGVGAAVDVSPTMVGAPLCRALVQALSFPARCLRLRWPRPRPSSIWCATLFAPLVSIQFLPVSVDF
ncbi:hypothetical protein ZWY2020_043525 [Hordeum vulgare]|nr:hypothetical protein ZWY2020_043525 [Hordeum vulgare]